MKCRDEIRFLADLSFFIYVATIILTPNQMLFINLGRVGICMVLGFTSLHRWIYYKRYHFLTWILIFEIFCLSSCMWSLNHTVALSVTKTIFWNMLCTVIIYHFLCKYPKMLLDFFTIITMVPVFWPIKTIVKYGPMGLIYVRSYMFGSDYSRAGMFSAWGAVFSLFMIIYIRKNHLRKSERNWWIFLFLLNLLICILTTSRKSLIALAISCFYLFFVNKKGVRKYVEVIIAAGIIIFVIALIFKTNASVYERYGRNIVNLFYGYRGYGTDDSTLGRIRRISRGMEWFRYKPFFGYGAENYSILSSTVKIGFHGIADNNFIELLVDLGIAGFLVYYSRIFTICIKSIKTMKKDIFSRLSVTLMLSVILIDWGTSSYKSAATMLIIGLCSFMTEGRGVKK